MEAPSVEDARQRYDGVVTFVGVAWAGSEESMNDFIARHGLTFASVNDSRGEIFASYGVSGQPAWVFVSASGDATRRLGTLSEDQLAVAIDEIA